MKSLIETRNGVTETAAIPGRLGRACGPHAALALISPPSGTLQLASGVDTVRIPARSGAVAFTGDQTLLNLMSTGGADVRGWWIGSI